MPTKLFYCLRRSERFGGPPHVVGVGRNHREAFVHAFEKFFEMWEQDQRPTPFYLANATFTYAEGEEEARRQTGSCYRCTTFYNEYLPQDAKFLASTKHNPSE